MIDYPLCIILPFRLIRLNMSIEFDTALPSIRQVQTLIKEAGIVELKLLTGDSLTGRIGWQDPHCLCLFDENNQPTTVWRQAIAYLKPTASPTAH